MNEFNFKVAEKVETVDAPKAANAWKWGLGITVVGGIAILAGFAALT